MGVEGAAIGTLVSRCSMLVFMAFYVRFNKHFIAFAQGIVWKKSDWNLFKKIIRLGFPSALQMFFEVVFFTAAIWLSGFLGKNPQAANQIALNLSSMTFMFAMGLGVTAMIRVGNQKGKGEKNQCNKIEHC